MEAAKAAAAAKAERAPHQLTGAEVQLLPGRQVLDLGNAGHLRHLGIGLPIPAPKAAKSATAQRAPAPLTDEQLRKLSAPQITQAIAAGRVPGIGPRRKGRRH